ncbi:MAG TPA: hypothetical protein VMU08_03960 [Rhizomicrobium sp.]|nr:hypothetical protein [Rhizomicrobium sp.]
MLRKDDFGRHRWRLVRLLALALSAAPGLASADDDASRADALVVMQAVIRVTTNAEYCNKRVRANPQLMTDALAWNGRQRAAIERVAAVIEKSGGLSKQEKDDSNATAAAEWKTLDVGKCDALRRDIESGTLDLDKHPDTAPALERLLDAAP